MHVARLEGLPLFEDLTSEEKAELGALLEPASFGAGTKILEEGAPTGYLYVITSGAVEVSKEVFPGHRQCLAILEKPAIVGEITLINGPRATASVMAQGPVEAWRLSHETFLEKLEAGSLAAYKVAYQIGRILAERMAKTDESIAEIVAQLEKSDRDFEAFRDKLIQEWSF
ncbi:MAG: family transcriptional regulator, cyclic receptor protein [Rubrobacteraceae bacterium]|nr:family transcriptional regulator, cyclic receptor protein [Rubrobacteraceae bacterium]